MCYRQRIKRKSIFNLSFQVSGIGKVCEKMLNALGVSRCSHLGQEMAMLSLLFSETSWHHFMQVSLGMGSTYIPRYLTDRTEHI